MIDLRWSFFVVRSGKVSRKSKRACAPKTESVPVPVRSSFGLPVFEHEPEEIEIWPHRPNEFLT